MKRQAIKILSLVFLMVVLIHGRALSAIKACILAPSNVINNKTIYFCKDSYVHLKADNCLNNVDTTLLQYSWINLDNPTVPEPPRDLFTKEPGHWELTLTNTGDGSTDKDTINLIYYSTPNFYINTNNGSASACSYGNINLSINTPPGTSTYQWWVESNPSRLDSGVTSLSIPSVNIPNNQQDYYIATADYNGTDSDGNSFYCLLIDSIYGFMLKTPIVSLMNDTSVCEGTTLNLVANVLLLPDSVPADPATLGFKWNSSSSYVNGDDSRTSSPSPGNQTYSVSVKNIFGCTTSDLVNITVDPKPVVSTGPATLICPGNNIVLNASVSAASGPYVYHWSPKASLNDSTLQSPTASPASSTVYSVLVESNKGCTGTATKTINVNPSITLTPNFTDTTTCGTDPIKLIATASGGGGVFTFTWAPSAEIDSTKLAGSAETAFVNPATPTKFTVFATDNYNCKSTTATINLDKLWVDLGGTDTLGLSNDSIKLSSFNSSQLGFSYRWKDSTGALVGSKESYIAKTTNKYTVEVYNPVTNCFVSDTKAVLFTNEIVQKVYVPNVFNPDLLNDENSHLRVYGNNVSDKDFIFQVYDSWGQIVYEASSFTEANETGWNGKLQNSGQLLNFGVYTYKLRGQFFDGSTFHDTGTATLIK